MRPKPIVLAIEDDADFAKAIDSVLHNLGLMVKVTDNIDVFNRYSKELKPDLYLVDLHITDTTGIDLIVPIRKDHPEAVIVVISEQRDPKNVEHALEAGANDFILKPLDRVHLASKLAKYLTTEKLREHSAECVEFSDGRAPAQLHLDVVIEEIDEDGMKILCPHFIPKGTVFKLRTDFWKSIGVANSDCLVAVTSVTPIADSNMHSTYVEFESQDPAFALALRRWLSSPA